MRNELFLDEGAGAESVGRGFEQTEAEPAHGGDLSTARQIFPAAPEPWLDLSTGVNPHCYPFRAPPSESFTRLPDPRALAGLEGAAAAAYGVEEAASVVAAPGTQAIINWLPHLLPAQRVGLLGFTYFEHARAWGRVGAQTSVVEDIDALEKFDVAIIVNPNNPDGRLVSINRLRDLADRFYRSGRLLIVDEAFGDFQGPSASLAPHLPPSGAVVLRSFGKAFGLPGVRLGFAVAAPEFAAKLRAALGCWPVSGAAVAIGTQALGDASWLGETRRTLEVDAEKLDAILIEAGLTLAGGTALFRLAEAGDAQYCFSRLGEAGILTRRFAERPHWLRFAIPGSEADRARLRSALI
ncbi:L-threonine-O-3-phosphate decarboxylase [Methylocella silvestris BL2]|uniref:threonine-phosphate decarboxylase n=1 Tax=Methylocella silvestris (strain DSM 15510 / CIP 108128 / LMG 27833 / NCIMB 13906 / BL2) TaxID=395965 RepID=B8EQG8_METSB|nr:threonine-phosphate decarboxylase CobD [Methylocella silvestris]ACK52181.1 L-threonine-O-3-phosphate decarboxylase [Methylocella silvestris BL2]